MISVDALARKYRLTDEETRGAVERGIEFAVSQSLGMDTVVRVEESLTISGFSRKHNEEAEQILIDPASLTKKLRRQIRYQVEGELQKVQVLREHARLVDWQGHVVMGEIKKIRHDGSLLVETKMAGPFRNDTMQGVCAPWDIPFHEKENIALGACIAFLVINIRPVQVRGGSYMVAITLSRRSKKLPEVLLQMHTGRTDIRCRRRLAGKFSEVMVSSSLPQQAIKAVSDELKERIKVHVLGK